MWEVRERTGSDSGTFVVRAWKKSFLRSENNFTTSPFRTSGLFSSIAPSRRDARAGLVWKLDVVEAREESRVGKGTRGRCVLDTLGDKNRAHRFIYSTTTRSTYDTATCFVFEIAVQRTVVVVP